MTAIALQKAYLYETRGSAKGRQRHSLDYKLEGRHATLACRDSTSLKGKFSLRIGRKVDLSKEKEEKENRQDERSDADPVILPKCREETSTDLMEKCESSGEESTYQLMRENTDDVPLTEELLSNDTVQHPTICSECAKLSLYRKFRRFKNAVTNDNKELNTCVICEKKKLLSRKSVKDEKTLLMSIIYPHDFYDRYQSVRRNVQTPSDDVERKRERKRKTIHQKTIVPKQSITLPDTVTEGDKVLLKPHVVKFKEKEKQRRESNINVVNHEFEIDNRIVPSNILPPLKVTTPMPTKPKHMRCIPQTKAYFVASLTSENISREHKCSWFDQKKSFRGFMLSRSEKFERPKLADVRHSLFNVGSLGLTIGIPEYNDKLGSRQTTTNNFLSRTCTSLTNLNRPQSLHAPMKNKVRPPGSVGHRSMP
ncbi:Hypothetical predicted protein [Mytilus galloprovincialis]|uniref:Uncharacterized protein n=1 Tax=Mytilus galloprovincialis TaxID=29158 RepID=A0A8B6G7D0_MYTGA|nr:Hypothetical predicted protein [Mytilus galloprovincialis]